MTTHKNNIENIGEKALQKIFTDLQIDEQWSEMNPNSFSWIAHRLQQSVRASKPIDGNGVTIVQISAETLVVENIQAPEELVLGILAETNRNALGSCYTYYPDEKKIYAYSFCWIHADTFDWRLRQFGIYVIGQITIAEMETDFLANRLMGTVAHRSHSTSGERKYRDDMLNLIGSLVYEHGQTPSYYANEFEMKTIEEIAQQSPYAATWGATENGISFETTFGDYTSLSSLMAMKRHRLLGNGLSYKTMIPTGIDFAEGSRIANMLNRKYRDHNPDNLHYGAWCVDTSLDGNWVVSYNGFLPNMVYNSGISTDIFYSCTNTARWVDFVMHSEVSEPNAWEQLADRTKRFIDGEL